MQKEAKARLKINQMLQEVGWRFFTGFKKRLKDLDRQNNHTEYMNAVRDKAKEIRQKLLKSNPGYKIGQKAI